MKNNRRKLAFLGIWIGAVAICIIIVCFLLPGQVLNAETLKSDIIRLESTAKKKSQLYDVKYQQGRLRQLNKLKQKKKKQQNKN